MPGLEAVYNRHGYSVEKRNALALWADHVHALVKNVTGRYWLFVQQLPDKLTRRG